MTKQIARRELLASLAAGTVAVGLPLVGTAADEPAKPRKLKVIVAGAHPDDPESAAGGTIARYTDLGHEVVCLYLTRGEAGMKGKTHKEAAAIRTAEAEKACEVLKARPCSPDRSTAAPRSTPLATTSSSSCSTPRSPMSCSRTGPSIRTAIIGRTPCWSTTPGSSRAGSSPSITSRSMPALRPSFSGRRIMWTSARRKSARGKRATAHTDAPGFYPKYHDLMNRFRGLECGCKYAEAFVHHHRGAAGLLP